MLKRRIESAGKRSTWVSDQLGPLGPQGPQGSQRSLFETCIFRELTFPSRHLRMSPQADSTVAHASHFMLHASCFIPMATSLMAESVTGVTHSGVGTMQVWIPHEIGKIPKERQAIKEGGSPAMNQPLTCSRSKSLGIKHSALSNFQLFIILFASQYI